MWVFVFHISFNTLWSLTYFFAHLYVIFSFSIILYCIPVVQNLANSGRTNKLKNFEFITGFDIQWLLLTAVALLVLITASWTGPIVFAWFGNLIFATFQLKITYLMLAIFTFVFIVYNSSLYYSSKEVFDFVIICFNFMLWLLLLFYSNNLLTLIFFIEILSTLIFVALVTSTFSNVFFYNNLNLNHYNYFSQNNSFFFIQTLLNFFWISLISSLNLFLFLILFYSKFLTLDWNIIEFILNYLLLSNSFKDYLTIALVWFNLIFCFFLKCGIAPFFFWKPTFFRGMDFKLLFFYIVFFYFFFFIFFAYFFLIYVNDLFFSFLFLNITIFLIGFIFLFLIIFESFYFKSFLAVSSILNSLFVFLTLNSTSVSNFIFMI